MNCRTVIWGSVAIIGVLIAAGNTVTPIGEDSVHKKVSLTDETSDMYRSFVS